MAEHLCVTCAILRPQGEPRIYDKANVCDGCRSRLRSLLGELVETYAQLCADPTVNAGEWTDNGRRHVDPVALSLPAGPTRSRFGEGRVSGSREAPLPLPLDPLDLTRPARHSDRGVEYDLVPQYERVETTVSVWLPADPNVAEYPMAELTISQRQRRRDERGILAWGPSGDQAGHPPAVSVLDSWARDWQTYSPSLLPDATVSSLSGWLTERLEWACNSHPAVDDFADELRALVAAVRKAAGLTRPKAELKVGVPCRECEKVALYRWPGSDYVECGSCPALLTPDEYDRWVSLISSPEHIGWARTIIEAQREEAVA